MSEKLGKIRKLSEKISKFEESRKPDFSDLKNFLKIYANTSDKEKRAELAETFKARRLELCDFLRKNPDLISAENEIKKLTTGNFCDAENLDKITNFFEIIEEKFYDL